MRMVLLGYFRPCASAMNGNMAAAPRLATAVRREIK